MDSAPCPYCDVGTIFFEQYAFGSDCEHCGRFVEQSEIPSGPDPDPFDDYEEWDR